MAKILVIYKDLLSTERVDSLKRVLRDKYEDDSLPIYTAIHENAPGLIKELKNVSLIFIDESIREEEIKKLNLNRESKIIKGVDIRSGEVAKFIESAQKI